MTLEDHVDLFTSLENLPGVNLDIGGLAAHTGDMRLMKHDP